MSSKIKGVITKDDLLKLKQVLDGIEADPQSFDFLEPVDYIGMDLYNK
jgi:hypothetical protein